MKLNCPACNAPIPPSSINIAQAIAVCPECGEVFRFDDLIPARKRHSRKLKPPQGIELIEMPEEEVLRFSLLPSQPMRRAATQAIYVLLALLGGLASFAVLRAGSFSLLSWLIALLPLVMVLLPVLRLVNHQVVVLGEDKLLTASRPISAFTGKTFMRDDLASVMTRLNLETTGQGQRTLDVDLRLKNGDQQIFLRNLNPAYAGFIAQEIDHWLHEEEDDQVLSENLNEVMGSDSDQEGQEATTFQPLFEHLPKSAAEAAQSRLKD